MQRIGLTGGIGSGKSLVGHLLAKHGLPVFDADQLGRELLRPGQPLHDRVCAHFPDCTGPKGELNRAALAERVFSEADSRRWLEAHMHPAIAERLDDLQAELPSGTSALVVEGAVLLESRSPFALNGLVVCWATRAERIQRVQARDGAPAAAVQARMDAQMAEPDKIQAATHFIDNSGTREQTRRQVERLARQLLAETGDIHES